MPNYAIFDVEADNLLPKLTAIHLVVVKSVSSGEFRSFRDPVAATQYLDTFDRIVGHNCIGFDLPALKKITGWTPKAAPVDTLLISRLLFPDRTTHPAGGSSLAKWGLYFKMPKGEFSDFSQWSEEMDTYCRQDVEITHWLLMHLINAATKIPNAVMLEHSVASIIAGQVANGFGFNQQAAECLLADMVSNQSAITERLRVAFPCKEVVMKTKTKYIPFNPGSRDMIAVCLMRKYGWKPKQFTETGKPQIDETILSEMSYPEAADLSLYLLLDKRIGMLNQYLECCSDWKMHGELNTNGALSGRMSHNNPNMAQVPRCGSPYGSEFRSLFRPTRYDWVQVGADAAGLELRMLAHYLAEFDGGVYAGVICKGDIHSHNQAMAGLKTRDQAKTFIYGLLYGAGDAKVGSIVDGTPADGAKLKNEFKRQVPGYARLLQKLEFESAKTKSLTGLDGRPLPVRSAYAALNLLLQSAGAVVMKKALVIMDARLTAKYPNGYAFMANIHDEVQIECSPMIAEDVGTIMVRSIVDAGVMLGLKCPLDGAFKVGKNWSETH